MRKTLCISAAMLALTACATEEIATPITRVGTEPGPERGEFMIAVAPTADTFEEDQSQAWAQTTVQFYGVFVDGSQLVIFEFGDLAEFTSPGNSGLHGYTAFGLPGNPQFLAITLEIVAGTGQFDGASGTATGTVKVAGGVGIITVTGVIILP